MKITFATITLAACFAVSACSSSSHTPDGGNNLTGGTDGGLGGSGLGGSGIGGAGPNGNGGNNAAANAPLFPRSECGTVALSDIKASSIPATPTMFALGQLVGGRVDPDSLTNQEHHWAIQLAPGFYHLVLDGRTADGKSTNVGLAVERQLATGDEQRLVSGNEVARYYRDSAFFEVKAAEMVALRVKSVFAMADYVVGVFANGSSVPSPLFDKCPTIMPLTIGQPVSFTLGADGSATMEQWFAIDLPLGNYKFALEAAQASGANTNLIYYVELLDRFGQEPRAKRILMENEVDTRSAALGTVALGETGAYWVRVRNSQKDLNVTMTVSAQ